MRPLALALITLGVFFVSAGTASAQQSPYACEPWIGIKSWQVSIHVQGGGTNTDSLGYTTSYQESDDIETQLLIDSSSPIPCSTGWSWTINQGARESIQINATTSRPDGCSEEYGYSRGNVSGGGASLSMDFVKGTYFGTYGVSIGASGNGGNWDTENHSGDTCYPEPHIFYESDIFGDCLGFDFSLGGTSTGGSRRVGH